MEQRGNVKKWISLVLFILLASLVVHRVYDVLSWKDTRGAYVVTTEQFYRTDKDLIDVAFFGSSHGYAAVDPTVRIAPKSRSPPSAMACPKSCMRTCPAPPWNTVLPILP